MKRFRRFISDGLYLELSPSLELPLDRITLEVSGGQTLVGICMDAEDVRELVSALQDWLTERLE